MENEDENLIEVPYDALSPEALRGVLEEYCTRGGYESELPLEVRVKRTMDMLIHKKARLMFNPAEENINIVALE